MSKYSEFSTTMRDPKHLESALRAMGFEVECHDTPQTLYGYHGDARPEKAHIIIRQIHTGIGASNDIGFLRGEDGIFRAIISHYDESMKFNADWMGHLKQNYQEQRTLALAKSKGMVLIGRDVIPQANGKQQVKLRFGVR